MPKKKSKMPKKKVRIADSEKELFFKEDGEDYAKITKKLGNARVMVHSCELDKEIICHIRGNIRKGSYKKITKDSYVLISFRNLNGEYDNFLKTGDSSNMTGDVLHNYSEQDVADLVKYGHISGVKTNEFNTDDEDEEFKDYFKKIVKKEKKLSIKENSDNEESDQDNDVSYMENGPERVAQKTDFNDDDIIDLI